MGPALYMCGDCNRQRQDAYFQSIWARCFPHQSVCTGVIITGGIAIVSMAMFMWVLGIKHGLITIPFGPIEYCIFSFGILCEFGIFYFCGVFKKASNRPWKSQMQNMTPHERKIYMTNARIREVHQVVSWLYE